MFASSSKENDYDWTAATDGQLIPAGWAAPRLAFLLGGHFLLTGISFYSS
jgi:hypothetical protein